ncbi:MAG: hypothetical protein HOH02_12015 [Oceanospirillaceae bacterium]|jgi:hypothetical protein|nr:hypothetical protein [Oceanospirillaceae bacterium]MBT6078671.1 hypothetical protein [Oceanospirillaceae bacterium]MBT7330008.1 hypothetical protein [Oceanospirillaceae bacterium]
MSDWFESEDIEDAAALPTSLLDHLPLGYELVTTAHDLRLYGDHNIDLMQSLHLAGGHWDPNLLAYTIPLGRQAQLEHALKHFAKQQQGMVDAMSILAAHMAPDQTQVEAQRRKRAVDQRIKIIVGRYHAGDLLKGHEIITLGRHWQEFPGSQWQGVDKAKCVECEKYSRVSAINECQICEAKRHGLDPVTYCYAYFD